MKTLRRAFAMLLVIVAFGTLLPKGASAQTVDVFTLGGRANCYAKPPGLSLPLIRCPSMVLGSPPALFADAAYPEYFDWDGDTNLASTNDEVPTYKGNSIVFVAALDPAGQLGCSNNASGQADDYLSANIYIGGQTWRVGTYYCADGSVGLVRYGPDDAVRSAGSTAKVTFNSDHVFQIVNSIVEGWKLYVDGELMSTMPNFSASDGTFQLAMYRWAEWDCCFDSRTRYSYTSLVTGSELLSAAQRTSLLTGEVVTEPGDDFTVQGSCEYVAVGGAGFDGTSRVTLTSAASAVYLSGARCQSSGFQMGVEGVGTGSTGELFYWRNAGGSRYGVAVIDGHSRAVVDGGSPGLDLGAFVYGQQIQVELASGRMRSQQPGSAWTSWSAPTVGIEMVRSEGKELLWSVGHPGTSLVGAKLNFAGSYVGSTPETGVNPTGGGAPTNSCGTTDFGCHLEKAVDSILGLAGKIGGVFWNDKATKYATSIGRSFATQAPFSWMVTLLGAVKTLMLRMATPFVVAGSGIFAAPPPVPIDGMGAIPDKTFSFGQLYAAINSYAPPQATLNALGFALSGMLAPEVYHLYKRLTRPSYTQLSLF